MEKTSKITSKNSKEINNNVNSLNDLYNITELMNIEEEYSEWMNSIYKDLYKRFYKKALNEIKINSKKFTIEPYYSKILLLKIKIILKIIEKKLNKYNFYNNENNTMNKHKKHTKKYLKIIFDELLIVISNIHPDLNDKIVIKEKLNKIDIIINYFFEYFYFLILFYKKCKRIDKSISIIIISLNFSKEVLPIIKNSKTLNIIAKIYLCFSKIFILNRDYENAILILEKSMNICLRELFYYSNMIFTLDNYLLKYDNKISNNIYTNVVLIFLYRGICKENEGYIKKAIKSYIQCKWFINQIVTYDNSYLKTMINILLSKLKLRGFMYEDAIDFIKLKLKDYNYEKKNKQKKTIYNEVEINSIPLGYYFDENKYKNIIDKINIINNIPEIDTSDNNKLFPSQKKKKKDFLLSNMRLLEAYLSKDFKGIIENMKQIKLFDLDYSTRDKIQKEFNRRMFLKSFKEKKNKSQILSISQFENKNYCKNSFRDLSNEKNNKININENKKNFTNITSKIFSNSFLYKLKKDNVKKIKCKRSSNSFIQTRQIHSAFTRLTGKSNGSPINRYIYEDQSNKTMIYFNKKYRNKINYIKELSDREIKFQKDLLSLKKIPKENIPIYNKFLCEKKANYTFEKLLLFSSIKGQHFYLNDKYSDDEFKEIKKELLLKNCIIKSLTDKAFLNYKQQIIHKKQKLNKNCNNKNNYHYYNNINNNNMIESFCNEDIIKQNKSTLFQLDQKIHNIDKMKKLTKEKEKNIEKLFNKRKNNKKENKIKLIRSGSTFIIRKENTNFDLNNFIHSILFQNSN